MTTHLESNARLLALLFSGALLQACGGDASSTPKPALDAGGDLDGGSAALPNGAGCQVDGDCTSGQCVTLGTGPTCVATCSADDCGVSEVCLARADLPSICVPESDAPVGAGCGVDSECATRLCADGQCVQRCGRSWDAPCATGQACYYREAGSYCTSPGVKTFGQGCTDDLECSSLACAPTSATASVCTQRCDNEACPSGYECANVLGAPICVVPGPGRFGQSCTDDFDCASLACLEGTATAANTCTQACNSASDCPSGFACPDLRVGQDICVPPGALTFGATCMDDYECNSLYCAKRPEDAAGTCSQFCDVASDCPQGYQCQDFYSNTGRCMLPGAGTFGQPCQHPLDCDTNLCLASDQGSFCSNLCRNGTCPIGYSCTDLGGLRDPACFLAGGTSFGGDCASHLECASLVCVVGLNQSFCSEACASDTPCPTGFGCHLAASGEQLCFPRGATALAEACTSDLQCESLDCQTIDEYGDQRCTQTCRPSDPTSCPSGTVCRRQADGEALCVGGGPSALGSSCSVDTDCASLECLDEFWNCSPEANIDLPAVCTQSCPLNMSGACPDGFGCVDVGEAEGWCMPASNGGLDDACTFPSDCEGVAVGGFCYACGFGALPSYCSGQCDRTSPTTGCPSSMECLNFQDGNDYCVRRGPTPTGGTCTSNEDCQGALCFSAGYCSAYCSWQTGSGCPSTMACISVWSLDESWCLQTGNVPYGGACTQYEDCQSGLCVLFGGGGLCTSYCDTGSSCPGTDACLDLDALDDGAVRQVCQPT